MIFFKQSVHRLIRRWLKQPKSPLVTSSPATPIENEISRLVNTVSDSAARKLFAAEMQSFVKLHSRYTTQADNHHSIDWNNIKAPSEEHITSYDSLVQSADSSALNKLAVLKLNGACQTSMGLSGAMSALEIKNGKTFLDLTIQQTEHLNSTYRTNVPLIFMSSFLTHDDTSSIIKNYAKLQVQITLFNQSKYPRILKDSFLPYAQNVQGEAATWYPPGHGDLYETLHRSGLLEQLLSEGKEYLFVSGSDNLGAIVDPKILQHMVNTTAEFAMEVVDADSPDVEIAPRLTMGTVLAYGGKLKLLETEQVPDEQLERFKDLRKSSSINTNNLWIHLPALKRIMDRNALTLDIVAKTVVQAGGQHVMQLETAAGAAINHFGSTCVVKVPRSRFVAVKQSSDLLLVRSDIYKIKHGQLVMNEQRMFPVPPVIKLSNHFRTVQDIQGRFGSIPELLELDHLTISGDVHIGRNVKLRGTVIIIADEGQRLDIPDNSVIENRLISGNLIMTVRQRYVVDDPLVDRQAGSMNCT
ncbi:hypothetical protein AX17_004585 [Amanita inopinata Kibby_2008]|nr:hypothetical protein AX17_004585 [Amanita inopinata Kibby_2008]